MTAADLQMVRMLISQALQQHPTHVAQHGVAHDASWTAIDSAADQFSDKSGTTQVTVGKTVAIADDNGENDDGDQGFASVGVDVATTAIGDQYAPRGGERTVMLRTEAGPLALFLHGADDSPGAPAGERWITHRNASGVTDLALKLANDGKAQGDGLGSLLALVGALFTLTTTGGFQAILADDATSTLQLSGGTNAKADAVVRQSDLVTLLASIQGVLDAWAAASLQPGSGAAGPTLTSIMPTGSSATFTA